MGRPFFAGTRNFVALWNKEIAGIVGSDITRSRREVGRRCDATQ
jgi:hypothetical protein